MAAIRQPSFASGELAPSLWGRTDLPRYGAGLRYLSNFIISKQGAAVSRPGTRFLGLANGDSVDMNYGAPATGPNMVTAGQKVRLIPFYYSDANTSENAVFEFGEQYFRVWINGVVINNLYYGGGSDYSTPYHAFDLPKIRYQQSGDVVVLACVGYPPAKITRLAANTFAFAVIDFSRPPPPNISPAFDAFTTGSADGNHPVRPWAWVVTKLTRGPRGQAMESAPVAVSSQFVAWKKPWNTNVVYEAGTVVSGVFTVDTGGGLITTSAYMTAKITNQGHNPADDTTGAGNTWWNAATTFAGPDGEQDDPFSTMSSPLFVDRAASLRLFNTGAFMPDASFITFRIYRGLAGGSGSPSVFGWVGDCSGQTFVDLGADPDFSIAPPQGFNPFEVHDPVTGVLTSTETPIAVCFFEDRLVFAGTPKRPGFIFASFVGDYYNFDRRLIPIDEEALQSALACRRRELIRWVAGKDKLFVGTSSSVWAVGGSNGPMTPTSIDAHVQVDIGADWPEPVVVGNSLLFIRDKGSGVRGIQFDFQRGTYQGEDLSLPAEHLLLGHSVADWCYAEDPWGVTWLVREDGVVLSLTYAPEDQVWAWARHNICKNTDGTNGIVQSVCTIPENGHDAVYLALQDPAGGAAWILRMSGRVEFDDEALNAINTEIGLEYALGSGLGGGSSLGTVNPSGFVGPGTPICLDAWTYSPGPFTSDAQGLYTFHGLTYLAGRSAWAIIDGVICGDASHNPVAVTNGGDLTVYGPNSVVSMANNVYIGLPFAPELETLDMAEARTKQKVVNRVGLEVKAGGKLLAGPDLGHLSEQDRPTTEDDLMVVEVMGNWTKGGRCAVRQYWPLPLTVRAITREVEAGAL